MSKPLIVGFDPGTTAALAILDTNGQLLFLYSKKGLAKKEILDNITARGKALIVAADRSPLPRSVEKLASILGSKVYYPVQSLSTSEKAMLIKSYKIKMKNDHEKDALASATKAYKVFAGLFVRTKNALDKVGLMRYYPEVIEKVVFEESENINEAIESVMQEKMGRRLEVIEEKKELVTPRERGLMKKIETLQEELKRREKDILILRDYNQKLKKNFVEVNRKLDYYRRRLRESGSSELRRVEVDVKRLEDKLEIIKRLRQVELEGYIPLIEIGDIRSDDVEEMHSIVDLTKRAVYCEDPSNAQILNEYDILALVSSKEPDDKVFEKVNFPIILEKNITLKRVNDIRAIEFKEFENKLREAKKSGLVEWLEKYRKRRL